MRTSFHLHYKIKNSAHISQHPYRSITTLCRSFCHIHFPLPRLAVQDIGINQNTFPCSMVRNSKMILNSKTIWKLPYKWPCLIISLEGSLESWKHISVLTPPRKSLTADQWFHLLPGHRWPREIKVNSSPFDHKGTFLSWRLGICQTLFTRYNI